MTMTSKWPLFAIAFAQLLFVEAWTSHSASYPRIHTSSAPRLHGTTASQQSNDSSAEDAGLLALRSELENYLKARKASPISKLSAENSAPKIVGGTRGNLILEYISGAPNVAKIIEEDPDDIFCYAELEKYGFTNLVAPIMENGGRLAMYELLDLPIPKITIKPESSQGDSEIVIDKRGETDAGRYSGLRMGLLDDSAMAEALQQAQRKQKEGLPLRSSIAEEGYVASYKDKRNVGPRMTPDWTAARIDDELSRQGDAISWARKAWDDRLMTDSAESLDLSILQQAYFVVASLSIAVSFGKATPAFLTLVGIDGASDQVHELLDIFKVPTLMCSAASLISSVLCSSKASEKRRSPIMWCMKGLLGGPLTLRQLQELPELLTRAEQKDVTRN